MTNNFAILRIDKIKSVSRAGERLRHNRRLIPCATATPGVKNARLILNEQMRKDKHKPFKQIFKERLGGQKIRKNAVYALEVVCAFSVGSVPVKKYKEWTKENAEWIKKIFGEKNIIDCQCHYDEKTFHNHFFVIPQDENGRLNARKFIGGSRNRMTELQTDYANAMEKFGLRRGVSGKITRAHHESSRRWHASQAEKEERLEAYEKKFGTEATWDFDMVLEFRRLKNKNKAETVSEQKVSITDKTK